MEDLLGWHSDEQSGKSHEKHWQQTYTLSSKTQIQYILHTSAHTHISQMSFPALVFHLILILFDYLLCLLSSLYQLFSLILYREVQTMDHCWQLMVISSCSLKLATLRYLSDKLSLNVYIVTLYNKGQFGNIWYYELTMNNIIYSVY